ncbi:MAG: preprotein translocase subunit SecE [Solirubrobacterales bacterium]
MAKTRAQRKAERRAREARRAREGRPSDGDQERAQHDTQVPESGEVAEVEAVLETGGQPEELGESVRGGTDVAEPEVVESDDGEVVEAEPEAPAPSRADVGAPARETRDERRARRDKEKEQRRKARAKEMRREPAEREERRRGAVLSFLLSCWAELKRVQWPDRETLIQASAVTLIFIAVAAAYLGALDAFFNWFVKLVL